MTDENPYQSPASVSADEPPLLSTEEWKRAALVVRVPAVLVVVLCVMGIVLHLGILGDTVSNGPGAFRILVCINLTLTAVHVFTICGALSMFKLRSIWFARTAMAVACIPYLSPFVCVGIPIGIWGLVVLCLPHVTAEFRAS